MKVRITNAVAAAFILTFIMILNIGSFPITGAESKAAILSPIEDGYIDTLQPAVNFAGANLEVEYHCIKPQSRQRWSFLLFNLTSIPLNSTIESAELYLYAFESHGTLRVGAFKSSDTSWNEKDLYWTPARETSVSQTSNNTQQITNVAWYHFSVKSEVQDSLQAEMVTLAIRPDYPQGFEHAARAVFYSNDQAGRPNTPRLEVVYSARATTDTPRPSRQRTAIILDTDPSRAGVGADVKIFGVLQLDGALLKDQPVIIEYLFNISAWKTISTLRTDEDGTFVITWRPEKAGSIQIRARYPGNENYQASESLTQLEVEPIEIEQFNSWYLLIITVTVAAAFLLLRGATKKRRKIESKPQPSPAQEYAKSEPKPPRPVIEGVSKRVSTGHKGLDRLLRGGLNRNYATALTSPSCDEVDFFTHRFLENGLQEGNSVLYITTRLGRELELAKRYETFHCIVCNPQADSILGVPNIYTTRGLDSLTEINLTVAKALATMDKVNREKVVFTGFLSDILLQHGSVATRQWLYDFISRMKSKSAMLFAVLNSQMHPREELESILDLFDGQIDLWEERREGETRKFIRIKRMYRERYSDESLPIERPDFP